MSAWVVNQNDVRLVDAVHILFQHMRNTNGLETYPIRIYAPISPPFCEVEGLMATRQLSVQNGLSYLSLI